MIVAPETASSAMRYFDRVKAVAQKALRAGPAGRLGLTPAQVRKAAAAATPLTPEETRRAMARQVRKGSCGRGGLPPYVIRAMFGDYQRLGSLGKVGALYGRTRQSMFIIFRDHGLPMKPREFYTLRVEWRGRTFTPGKDGYLRATTGDRRPLHRLMWETTHGPVPPGYEVTFKNGNRHAVRMDNLDCLPRAVVTRLTAGGNNQFTPETKRRRQPQLEKRRAA